MHKAVAKRVRDDEAPVAKTARMARLRLLIPVVLTAIAYPLHALFLRWRAAIHVSDIYHAELKWFGIHTSAGLVTPNEWLAHHTFAPLDFICGLSYLTYMLPSVALFVYLAFTDLDTARWYAWSLLALHLLAFVTYIVFPAAPPWYVALHGLGPANPNVPPSPAGVARFDALVGIPLGHAFYENNANVFGAIPSLHVGLQMLAAIVAWPKHKKWSVGMIGFLCIIFFSALYLNHHYVIDLLLGIAASAIAATVTHVSVTLIGKSRKAEVPT